MATLARKNETASEYFTVVDGGNNLVPGIDSTDFTLDIYDPDDNEVSSSIVNNIVELSNGNYRFNFIPNKTKLWYVVVYHATHFPWGKAITFDISENSLDTIASNISRILGLSQENYYLDQAIYNTYTNKYKCLAFGRIRIYSDSSSVGTSSNVVATYQITATYNEPTGSEQPTLETYKVIKL